MVEVEVFVEWDGWWCLFSKVIVIMVVVVLVE